MKNTTMANLINNTYEHELAFHYHNIDMRGLLVDVDLKENHVRPQCEIELKDNIDFLENLWNVKLYLGAENKKEKDSTNVGAPEQLLALLKELNYEVPKIRKKNEDTDEYEMKDSVAKLALVTLMTEPERWPNPQAGEGIKRLMDITEIKTFRQRYLNARLYKDTYYCNYNVAGTTTGRRGSKKSILGIGGNAQNFPARGRLASLWKECIIARPSRIFFFVDQVSAEDWPVQALAQNTTALDEMRRGVNRHYKFASNIFGISPDELKAKRTNSSGLYTKEQQDEAEMQYYMGKKGRHANNYGMQPKRFSESLASEGGFTVPLDTCKNILTIIDRIDPNVKRIFHNYIQECLRSSSHLLRTPLGRERAFLGLRSGEKNYNIFNEANAYIPQSTVGDNTGLAVIELEKCHSYIVQDGHDSLCQEVPDREEELVKVFRNTGSAFKRTIRFHNGIEIDIPIEGQLGYDWKHKVALKEFTEEELVRVYRIVKKEKEEADFKRSVQRSATQVASA